MRPSAPPRTNRPDGGPGPAQEPSARWSAVRPLAVRLLVAAVSLFLIGLGAFAVVTIDAVSSSDEAITARLHRAALDVRELELAARVVTWLGHPFVLTAVVAGAFLVLVRHSVGIAWRLVGVTSIGAVTETALKLTISRTRPDIETSFLRAHGTSFPSGHAMNTTIVLVVTALALTVTRPTLRRSALFVTTATAAAVGLTRPVLGVHFLSDIVAGFALAALWVFWFRREFRMCPPRGG